MLKIYHNTRCSKSRSACELLSEHHQKFETVEYLKTPPSAQELDHLLKLLGMEPHEIVRKGEDAFKELKLDKNPPKTRKAWIDILAKNPILIERPIVTDGKKAVIGRPPERVLELISGKSK